ncbi:MAG: phosphoribosylformylglycinamidine synthase subunit PurL [Candidatus Diapherotrites archaeon]
MSAKIKPIKITTKSDSELKIISKEMILSLTLEEMKIIQNHFLKLGREPTDAELETLAQTWSEHCKHKVFNAEITYTDENGNTEVINSLFKTYIKAATDEISENKNWLVSVFKDNAGIISFDDKHDIAFKVETHNHPSALEPYGGANTGIGGVIRDVLGCGLGAKPIANTDIFCFGLYNTPAEKVPEGILHPKRIIKGVRSGVRDYGNRMGIPTVNGAIIFDERYLGNPLVYCGTLGIMPKGMHEKSVTPGSLIVAIGGRTGRDGIHGATFSSVELDEASEVSAVQIGNAIEEKKFTDVLLEARDEKLYECITDCGAGGFSSAVGEMGEETGAVVQLENAPLKYKGLMPWEIWVSEAQERMILSVPEPNKDELFKLCEDEDVEATVLGHYADHKKLVVTFNKETAIDLDMEFLHNGLPSKKMTAKFTPVKHKEPVLKKPKDLGNTLKEILAMPNIASKETTIRQYDHEVQASSVLKPLVGVKNDSPGDAAIIKPLFDSYRGIILSNGINSKFSDIDTYWMAASVIDEAIRNIIAVGGSLEQIAILDNFCWGNPNNEQKLAELVRTAKACYDVAIVYETPFISGKDSFYNEFILGNKTISIPSTLLISAVSVMKDVRKRITMDLKTEGNLIYVLGETSEELGASHYFALNKTIGKSVPKLNAEKAKKLYNAISKASDSELIESMHDCSEGGLAVALAEMAFASDLGCEVKINKIPINGTIDREDYILFSESNSRFIAEVKQENEKEFEKLLSGNVFAKIGRVTNSKKMIVKGFDGKDILNEELKWLKKAWKETLNW